LGCFLKTYCPVLGRFVEKIFPKRAFLIKIYTAFGLLLERNPPLKATAPYFLLKLGGFLALIGLVVLICLVGLCYGLVSAELVF
jgi:hypothetical protein